MCVQPFEVVVGGGGGGEELQHCRERVCSYVHVEPYTHDNIRYIINCSFSN